MGLPVRRGDFDRLEHSSGRVSRLKALSFFWALSLFPLPDECSAGLNHSAELAKSTTLRLAEASRSATTRTRTCACVRPRARSLWAARIAALRISVATPATVMGLTTMSMLRVLRTAFARWRRRGGFDNLECGGRQRRNAAA